MESLGSLARFVDKNPQVVEGILQYAFLGGTAIRLTQEKAQYEEEMRDFSDFDVLVFGDGQYPIHQSSLDNILGSFSVSREDALGCISDVELNGRNYRFMDGNFLTLTKTCVVDCQPREKDYKDVFCLNDLANNCSKNPSPL